MACCCFDLAMKAKMELRHEVQVERKRSCGFRDQVFGATLLWFWNPWVEQVLLALDIYKTLLFSLLSYSCCQWCSYGFPSWLLVRERERERWVLFGEWYLWLMRNEWRVKVVYKVEVCGGKERFGGWIGFQNSNKVSRGGWHLGF